MNRISQQPVLSALIAAVVAVLLLASTSNPAIGQSPMFPNTQPVYRQTFRDFPYHKYRIDDRWGPVFPPDVIIMRRPRPAPNSYHTPGYGSSPYIRFYGGAGSSFPQ